MRFNRAVVGGLAAWNFAINRKIPQRHYVPANLAASAVVLAAGWARADAKELGLRRGSGIATGVTAAAVVAAGSWVASRLPLTAPLFADQRVSDDDVAYQTLVRIPLGTVSLEELAFRSVLPVLLDGAQRERASVRSAALFGLWHIIPTLNTLDINGVSDPQSRRVAVVTGVVSTAVAGLIFDKLRLRSGSVVAPMLVHWSANAVSYLIAASGQAGYAEAPE